MSWYQCVVSTIICYSVSRLSRKYPSVFTFPEGNPLDIGTFRKLLPLTVLYTLMIGANNLSLTYVTVAFYYIGRSLTTVFSVVLTYVILRQRTSFKCLLCCGAIVIGFWLGVDQESLTKDFSWRGTIFGVLSSLALAMYSIQTKKALVHVNQEIWLLSYYNNLYSTILFLPLIVLNGELSTVIAYPYLWAGWFWAAMTLSGFCGFAIGFVTALEIKVCDSLFGKHVPLSNSSILSPLSLSVPLADYRLLHRLRTTSPARPRPAPRQLLPRSITTMYARLYGGPRTWSYCLRVPHTRAWSS